MSHLLRPFALSLGLHAAVLSVFPLKPLLVRGLGFGAPAPPPSECPVRFVATAESAPPPEEILLPLLPPPAPLDSSCPDGPLPSEENALGGWADKLTVIELPPPPEPGEAAVPRVLAGGDLSVSIPPPPHLRETSLPIRIEDIRWNRRVGNRIGQSAMLTPELKRLGLHGSVRLVLYLTPEGRIRDLRVQDPGPHPALGLAALAQVRAAAPFPPAPPGVDERLLRIPVNLHY